MNEAKVSRWLVVGSGRAGQVHLAALVRSPAASACGLVSRAKDSADGVPVFRTLTEGLEKSGCDGVVIATPPHTHLELCREAIAAGVPVFCEKPVGLHAGQAQEMARIAAAAGVPIGVVLNQRACLHNRHIRELVRDGQLEPRAAALSISLPRLGGWLGDPAQSGGGVLRTIGIHYVDLLRWWFGEADKVSALCRGRPCEDRIVATASFGEQVIASIHASATGGQASALAGPHVQFSIEGDDARLILAGHEITASGGVPEPPPVEAPDPALWFGPGHLTLMTETSQALQTGTDLPTPLADALPSLELVDRIYAAAGRTDLAGG